MESIALKTLKSMLTARGLEADDFESLGSPLDERSDNLSSNEPRHRLDDTRTKSVSVCSFS